MKVSPQIAILTSILVSAAIGAGCTQQKKPLPPVPNRIVTPSTITPMPRNVPPSSFRAAPRYNTTGTIRNEAQVISNRLAKRISKMKYVNSATVIIAGSTAYVGLDVKANIEATKTNALKRNVINYIKKHEKRITTVTVATDPDTITRLRTISQGIAAGTPISTFTKELNEIGRRIIPSVR